MTTDLDLARRLAAVLTAAGEGRIRRVALIGSRARGDARPDSDLDLAVIVEPDRRSWGPGEVAAERARLQRVLDREHPGPPRAEVFVTTAEQFAAAQAIFGGVDWQIQTEGVDLHREPFRRRAVPRRTPVQVRNGYAAAWAQHAHAALEAAYRGEPGAARAALERALAALLVVHQLPATKSAGAAGFLRLLSVRDPAFVEWVERATVSGITPPIAHAVLKGVVERISADPAAEPYVVETRASLARPAIYVAK